MQSVSRLSHLSIRLVHRRPYSQTFAAYGGAVEKLRAILQEYRSANYQQTVPTRFVKEILKAVDENKDGMLEKAEFQHFLDNIGAGDKLTSEDLDEILAEITGEEPGNVGEISIARAKEVLMEGVMKK